MRYFVILFLAIFFVSCNSSDNTSNEKTTVKTQKEKFVPDMYVASEMTMLMRSMYDVNEAIKKEIVAGNTPETFPKDLLNIVCIHTYSII